MSCVLTLGVDDAAQARFEALRQQWFPPVRNQIPAHVTLFHSLPEGLDTDAVLEEAGAATRAFAMRVGSVRSLGRGVALFLDSPEAGAMHRRLSTAFAAVLSQQDRQGFRPHVVVQNKVLPEVAKVTLATVQAGFQPWSCQAVGLDLWRYLGGPWQHLRRFVFTHGAAQR